MAADGIELGRANVVVVPIIESLGKLVNSELSTIGKSAGKLFGSNLAGGAKEGLEDLEAAERKHAATAKKAAADVEKARETEQNATRKLEIEEQKLAELRASGKAKTSQILAAEDRVTKAKGAAAKASRAVAVAVDSEKKSLDAANKELEESKTAADKAAKGFSGFGAKIKSAITKGIGKNTFKGFDAQAKTSGNSSGKSYGNSFLSGAKAVFAGGAALGLVQKGAGLVTDNIGAGINQSDATDKFRQTLKFAGQSEAEIKHLTGSAQSYADATVYELSDIQNSIAQLTANGVKNADGLVMSMGNLNAIAGGNAETFGRVGMVMSQTVGAGKLTTENWNQLADAIPGAAGILQKSLKSAGAYTGDFREAMAKGQISAQEFNAAINQTGSSDTAKEAATSTKTVEGAWGNLQATITGKIADIVTKFKPMITDAINGLSDFFGSVGTFISPALDKIGDGFNFVKDGIDLFVGWFTGEGSDIEDFPFYDQITGAATEARQAWDGVVAFYEENAPKVQKFITDAFNNVKTWFEDNGPAIQDSLTKVKDGILAVFGWIVDNKETVAAFAGTILAIVAAMRIWAGVQAIVTVAQLAFNAAANANPIGIIITLIAALVAGLVYAYQNSETFRNVVNQVWAAVSSAVKVAGDFILSVVGNIAHFFTQTLPNALRTFHAANVNVFNLVKGAILGFWNTYVKPVVTAIVRFFIVTLPQGFLKFQFAARKVFAAVIAAVRSFWYTRVKPVVDALVRFFTVTIPQGFTNFKNKASNIFNLVVAVVRAFWFTRVKPVVDRLVSFFTRTIPGAFATMRDKARDIFNKVKEFVQNILGKDDKSGIRGIFKKGVEKIGSLWSGLQDLAKKPISFIIDTVINGGLIKAFNSIVDLIPVDQNTKDGWKLKDIPKPPGFDQGGYTGPGARLQPAGIVHADEFVVKKSSRRAIESAHPGALDYMNRFGRIPGYSGGGRVWPGTTRRLSGNYRGHSGIDIPDPGGSPIFAAADGSIDYTGWGRGFGQAIFQNIGNGLKAVYGHTSRVLVSAGQRVAAGQRIGLVGSTGHSTGDHIHFEINGAGGFGNSANRAFTMNWLNGSGKSELAGVEGAGSTDSGGALGWIIDEGKKRLKAATDGLFGGIPNSGLGAVIRAIPGILIDKLGDGIKAILPGGASGDWGKGSGTVDGPSGPTTRAIAAIVGEKFGASGSSYPGHSTSSGEGPTRAVDFMTKGKAQGDAIANYLKENARALGVKYLIWWKRIWNIQRDAEGWRDYFDGNSSDPSRAHTNHVHVTTSRYGSGTDSARGGWAKVGEFGPEYLWLGGGETILNNRNSSRVAAASSALARQLSTSTARANYSKFSTSAAGTGVVPFVIVNWETGEGHFRQIAADEVNQTDNFNYGINRWNGGS